jgi:hypothetical protein
LVKHQKIIATDHLLKNKEKENELDQPNNSSKEGPENEIILSQNDHEDFSARLKTFLTSQRDAVLRKSTGRRWNKEIIRLCLTLWCRSPRGYVEYLVELSFHLLKAHPHILQVTNFYSLPHLTSNETYPC